MPFDHLTTGGASSMSFNYLKIVGVRGVPSIHMTCIRYPFSI